MRVVREPSREGAPLDLLFASREGLVDGVMVGGCLGHSNHRVIEFLILDEVREVMSRTATLDFGQTLTYLETWLTESFGNGFDR